MWSLLKDNQALKPLSFSNGKSQEDVVNEVVSLVKSGKKIIFIKGMCGTGKSAIALNIAKELGKASIIVPIKSLQEQYRKDYDGEMNVLRDDKKLKISSIIGRKNFQCRYLNEEKKVDLSKYSKEKNAKLSDIFEGTTKTTISQDKTCNNSLLPCKIEIKEKNIHTIKDYIRQNPKTKITNFDKVSEVKRLSIAPICPYYSPIIPKELEISQFKDAKKITYTGLDNKEFVIYQRKPGCGFYDQHTAYVNSDVIIFNSAKYLLEVLMDRKPATDVEIIDECDDFLDSFANKEGININRLSFALSMLFPEKTEDEKLIAELTDITNVLKKKQINDSNEIYPLKDSLVDNLLSIILSNQDFLDRLEVDDNNYMYHLDKVAKTFQGFKEETFFSFERRENEIFLHLVTTNLAKRFHELVEKNKALVLMSGTLHSENVLKNIFGIQDFPIIDAETKHQGELIKCKHGYEIDCKYSNLKKEGMREKYLLAFEKAIKSAKPPVLVHITAFSDLPTEYEKNKWGLYGLITQNELVNDQFKDPLGKRIDDFKKGKTNKLFTTKCNRGMDFPGETCNSIVVSRFPYPNISSIFWKILRRNKPQHFNQFYMDKSKRELLQKIYRGLRSKKDRIYLLSPDKRVLDFEMN